MVAEAGEVIGGRYRILTRIGEGGMSTVYLAMDTVLNKSWAAKEIRHVADPVQRELVVQGIVTEANMIKRFDHPAIPRIVDIVDEDGTLFVIMDYVEGRTLADVLASGGPQAEDDVADWGVQLCDVLDYLHHRTPPVIYRDMKPSNVMLKPNGAVSLIDFGIAREYKADDAADKASKGDTVRLGTRGFAAPEQYEGDRQTDERSDVYALGATLYNLLTGKSPAEPPYTMVPVRQVVPDASAGIERVIARATQSNPDDRYQSAAEMAYALEHYGEQDAARTDRLRRTWRLFVGGCAACAVSLAVGGFGLGMRAWSISRDYDHWMQVAEQSSDQAEAADAYVRASELDPGAAAPYRGLVKLYRADQDFSASEDQQLRAALLPNLGLVSSSPEWPQLAFEVGKLYWYSYDAGQQAAPADAAGALSVDAADSDGRYERIRAASQWMRDAAAATGFDQHDLAQAYADIAEFNTGIVPLINEGSDEGQYRPYLDELGRLVDSLSSESNDVMRLQGANLALDALRTYPRKFRIDGVGQDEMLDLADRAADLAASVSPTTEKLDAERERALASVDAARAAISDSFVDVGVAQS